MSLPRAGPVSRQTRSPPWPAPAAGAADMTRLVPMTATVQFYLKFVDTPAGEFKFKLNFNSKTQSVSASESLF